MRPRIQNDVARFDDDGRELCIQSEGSNLQFDGKLKIIRTIAAGERFDVLITLSEPAGLTRFGLHDIDYLESSTIRYWRDWTSKIQYNGPYSEQVVRSAITLKLLQFSATGAMVAAPIFRRWISPSRMPNEPAPSGGAAQH